MFKCWFQHYFHCRTTQSAAAGSNQLTFTQIEELINKYTSELEEQEKVFINQATQVNSWDNLLNRNSKKVNETFDIQHVMDNNFILFMCVCVCVDCRAE